MEGRLRKGDDNCEQEGRAMLLLLLTDIVVAGNEMTTFDEELLATA